MSEQGRPTADQCHTECGDGAEFRAQDHGADQQDLGIQHDGDRGDQGGQGHETHVGPVEFGLFVGALRDIGPHHRVGTAAGRFQFGVEAVPRQPGVDGLYFNRALVVHAQGA